jgi:Fe-S-cluster containining protein
MVLTYRDIEKIQKAGYAVQLFVQENDQWLQLKNANGRCVFHDGTRCTIYPLRPEGCTLYPVVYDKDTSCAILDDECPRRVDFSLSKHKTRQIETLVNLLEKERAERKKGH